MKGAYSMNYTAAVVSRETAEKRRAGLEALRNKVRQNTLVLNPNEELRVTGTPYLLPSDLAQLEKEGAVIRGAVVTQFARELFTISQTLFRLYNYREADPQLILSLYDYAASYIKDNGDVPSVLLAVLDEVERCVQIPQEEQATA